MATSTTIVAALKYKGGVVIGADSQVSDQTARVRWPIDKLDPLPGGHPCVLGFSGSTGKAQEAWSELERRQLHASQLNKRELARKALVRCLSPIYESIKNENHPPTAFVPGIALWGIAAMWAEHSPQILEFEINGATHFHDSFHAIGSAGTTAYAIYRTVGGSRLCELDEPKALLALLRILRTCVNVEMWGVDEPLAVWTINAKGLKLRSPDELQPQLQLVEKWEKRERDDFWGWEPQA